jgi:hypothetical protein
MITLKCRELLWHLSMWKYGIEPYEEEVKALDNFPKLYMILINLGIILIFCKIWDGILTVFLVTGNSHAHRYFLENEKITLPRIKLFLHRPRFSRVPKKEYTYTFLLFVGNNVLVNFFKDKCIGRSRILKTWVPWTTFKHMKKNY